MYISSSSVKFILAFIATLSFPKAAYTTEDLILNFGVYTSDKHSEMYKKFRPALKYLENTTTHKLKRNTRIHLRIFKCYEEATDALVEGKVDFVRFGPASYIHAKDRKPGISILSAELNNGKKIFQGIIFVRSDSPIKNMADLKGKSFAFGNKFSTIGHYLSQVV